MTPTISPVTSSLPATMVVGRAPTAEEVRLDMANIGGAGIPAGPSTSTSALVAPQATAAYGAVQPGAGAGAAPLASTGVPAAATLPTGAPAAGAPAAPAAALESAPAGGALAQGAQGAAIVGTPELVASLQQVIASLQQIVTTLQQQLGVAGGGPAMPPADPNVVGGGAVACVCGMPNCTMVHGSVTQDAVTQTSVGAGGAPGKAPAADAMAGADAAQVPPPVQEPVADPAQAPQCDHDTTQT